MCQDILDTNLQRGTVWQFFESELIASFSQAFPLDRYKYHPSGVQLFLGLIFLTPAVLVRPEFFPPIIDLKEPVLALEAFLMRRGRKTGES